MKILIQRPEQVNRLQVGKLQGIPHMDSLQRFVKDQTQDENSESSKRKMEIIWLTADFLQKNPRGQKTVRWHAERTERLKKTTCQTKLLCASKLSFQLEDERKTFSNKHTPNSRTTTFDLSFRWYGLYPRQHQRVVILCFEASQASSIPLPLSHSLSGISEHFGFQVNF